MVPNGSGLTNLLFEESEARMNGTNAGVNWRNLLQRNVAAGLDVLTSGPSVANPAESLSSPRMSRLVSEALLNYDFVLLDSPPFFVNAADVRILTPVVDGTVLVVRSGMTPRDVVQRALAQCSSIIGIVLNDVDIGEFPAYYRFYDRPEASAISKGDA
jgi:Mrp family chromosome partitioning ATPase